MLVESSTCTLTQKLPNRFDQILIMDLFYGRGRFRKIVRCAQMSRLRSTLTILVSVKVYIVYTSTATLYLINKRV